MLIADGREVRALGEVLHEGAGTEDGPVLAVVDQPLVHLAVSGPARRQASHAEEHEAADATPHRGFGEGDQLRIRVSHRGRSDEVDGAHTVERRIPGRRLGPVEGALAVAGDGAMRRPPLLQLRDQAPPRLAGRTRHEHQAGHAAAPVPGVSPRMKASTAADPRCAFRPWSGFQ